MYFGYRFLNVGLRFEKYEGTFICNDEENEMILINRYDFSYELCEYFKAAFYENNALNILWNKEPLTKIFEHDEDGNVKVNENFASIELVKEATEYFILTTLSTHLEDYFNDEKFKKENIKEFRRNDIPSVLLTNKFLELFSKPMSQRIPFINSHKNNLPYEIVASYGEGAIYEYFNLWLPKESKITRTDKGIIIETNRFILTFEVLFEGYGSNLPIDFEKYYLEIDDDEKISAYEITIFISMKFKITGFFSRAGWEYYQWLDSFLGTLNQEFSSDVFFEKIGWENALTLLNLK